MHRLLLVALSAALARAEEAPQGQYLVNIQRGSEYANRFCADISVDGGAFRLESEAYPDIVLAPERPAAAGKLPAPGAYLLSLKDLRKPLTAVAGQDGGSLLFVSTAAVDLRLTPQGCPAGLPAVDGWYSPFLGGSRKALGAIRKRVVGRLGDFRASRRMTRKHAGVDLRGAFGEEVYPIAAGRVVALSFRALTGTVLVKHDAGGGRVVYSKYIHLQDIPVKVGQEVTPDTRIGRLFDKAMLQRTRYKHNHLHLEIRKSYADKGLASSYGRTTKLLSLYCYDPLDFFQKHLKERE